MGGGLGFIRHGQDSYKNNRKLLKARPLMKDNLISSSKEPSFKKSQIDYEELKQYNLNDHSNKRKARRRVYLIIVTSVFISVVILILLNG